MSISTRLINYMTAEPFRPFRISMSNGDVFEICHGDMIQIGSTRVFISTWMNEDNDDPTDRERQILIELIDSVELLDSPLTANQAGE